jgi:hypothetical protein
MFESFNKTINNNLPSISFTAHIPEPVLNVLQDLRERIESLMNNFKIWLQGTQPETVLQPSSPNKTSHQEPASGLSEEAKRRLETLKKLAPAKEMRRKETTPTGEGSKRGIFIGQK